MFLSLSRDYYQLCEAHPRLLIGSVKTEVATSKFRDAIFELRRVGTPPTVVLGPRRITELRYSAELCDPINCLRTITFAAEGMEEAVEILLEAQRIIDDGD